MATHDKAFTGSIPDLYEKFLVPLIFTPYAEDLAGRVAATEPRRILETACGTGVLTRAALARAASDVCMVATDLNDPMLAKARSLLPNDQRVAWRQADAQHLPFPDASFDTVVCQFGAMFFPDKPRAYAEARRTLAPGGRFLFNIWDRIDENDFAQVVTETLAQVFPDDPPRFLARTPHGHGDPDRIRDDLQEAGYGKVSIEAVDATSRAASPRDPAVAYCQGTPLRGEIETRGTARLEEATAIAADALARRFGKGPIEGRIRAFVVAASG